MLRSFLTFCYMIFFYALNVGGGSSVVNASVSHYILLMPGLFLSLLASFVRL